MLHQLHQKKSYPQVLVYSELSSFNVMKHKFESFTVKFWLTLISHFENQYWSSCKNNKNRLLGCITSIRCILFQYGLYRLIYSVQQ